MATLQSSFSKQFSARLNPSEDLGKLWEILCFLEENSSLLFTDC